MFRKCKHCEIELTQENASKAYGTIYRRICKKCRSKNVMKYQKNTIEHRRAYKNKHARDIGKVKQYPCLTCSTLCYKKYAKAFCSDQCRFMSFVNITETCWLWTGCTNYSGYGKMYFNENKTDSAHRVSYKLFNGPIDNNLCVCHACDNPICVKPEHLWLGTRQDNKSDQLMKDRGGLKLNSSKVLQIRKLLEDGIDFSALAKFFEVTCSTISNIARRKAWKHI